MLVLLLLLLVVVDTSALVSRMSCSVRPWYMVVRSQARDAQMVSTLAALSGVGELTADEHKLFSELMLNMDVSLTDLDLDTEDDDECDITAKAMDELRRGAS